MIRPLLAITQGDPTGIGPEIIVGAWSRPEFYAGCRAVVIGHPEIFERAAALLGSKTKVARVDRVDQVESSPGVMPCLPCGPEEVLRATPATIDPRGGQAAYDALVTAARLALDGYVDGIVTAPLHKAALWRAGHQYPGHTELLAELCGVNDYAMMLYLGALDDQKHPHPHPLPKGEGVRSGLGVVHMTLHMALREALASVSTPGIVAKARLVNRAMQQLNGSPPRIGVCALNPHAGEEGLFGDEEQRIIAPAVEQARREGMHIEGPLPADTLMVRARDGQFDAVVAMYHDQGHIALKLLGMHRAVNVTLGLPIVRTSVAHGTAFDLAWQGLAETTGMVEAVRVAALLAQCKRQESGVRVQEFSV